MSFTIDRVSTDGFTMEYMKFGRGTDTLVILPGLSVQSVLTAAEAIEKQYALFDDDFTVYLFDRRAELPPVYTVRDMANDTARALRVLGLHDVCLFGASQGGMMAMMIAADCPDLVRRVALGSTACRMDGRRFAAIEKWIALAEQRDAAGLYLSFGEAVYSKDVFGLYREALLQMAATVTDGELNRFVTLARGTEGFDCADSLKRLCCPVLVTGDCDDAVLGPDAAREIAERLRENPDFELHMYSGCGHASYDTAPDYRERLYRFFTK